MTQVGTKVSRHYDKNFTGSILENYFKQREIKMKRNMAKRVICGVSHVVQW